MKKDKGIFCKNLAIALAVLAVTPVVAHDGASDDPEPEGPSGMERMEMGKGTMHAGTGQHEGMMQMMVHCSRMMEQVHGEGAHGHD